MTQRPTCSVPLALLLATMIPGSVLGQAGAPDHLRDFVYPRSGAAMADEFHVLYADNCGRPHLDPRRAPEVVHGPVFIEVDIYLVREESTVCLAVVQPDTLRAIPIGTLAKGDHPVVRRLHVRPSDLDTYTLELTSYDMARAADAPASAASGTWYDPKVTGNGVVLNLLPGDGDQPAQDALLFLATRTLEGEADWLSGVGRFSEGVLSVPLRRAGTPGSAPPDVLATFTYRGCGSATFEASETRLAFPQGTVTLQQLTYTDAVPPCEPPSIRPYTLD